MQQCVSYPSLGLEPCQKEVCLRLVERGETDRDALKVCTLHTTGAGTLHVRARCCQQTPQRDHVKIAARRLNRDPSDTLTCL